MILNSFQKHCFLNPFTVFGIFPATSKTELLPIITSCPAILQKAMAKFKKNCAAGC